MHSRTSPSIASIVALILFACLAAVVAPVTAQPTQQDLANDPALFLATARKALHWDDPAEPAHLLGPLYFVGTKGLDEIIVFRPLERSQIRKIVDLQIEHLAKLLEKRDLGLVVTEEARQEIANRGYDPQFGARPLKRVIQQQLQNPLAAELLKGEYPEGSTVTIDFDGGDFTFTKSSSEPGKPRDRIVSAQAV